MQCTIYTDGGCRNNPGPGAWAFLLLSSFPGEGSESEPQIYEDSGFSSETTNNRMELEAVIRALSYVEKQHGITELVTVHTDSQYVQKGITEWLHRWKKNGWKTTSKKPVKNKDLWLQLSELVEHFTLRWEWVPGHSNVYFNERCDLLVQKCIQKNSS